MMRSLFSGVNGLRNHQVKMDVIGNNIANVNTYGFKMGRVTFQDIISQTLQGATAPQGDRGGINPKQVGLGMKVGTIDNIHSQGGLEATANLTDLAIDGEGFFVLRDGTTSHYTRAGMFTIDANQNLVHSTNGFAVQGWSDVIIDATTGASRIDTSQPIGDIAILQGQKLPARATTNVMYASNLNSAALGETVAGTDDLAIELTNNAGINLNLSIGSQVRVDADATTPGTFTTLTVANTDGAPNDGQFATYAGLADEIEAVLQTASSTIQVSIAANGTMTINNPTGAGANQLDVNITALDSSGANPITNFNGVFSIANGVMNIDDNIATSTLRVANHQTSIITYDSLGNEHNLTVVFTRTSTENVWTWEANLPTADTAASSLAGNNGTFTFDVNGLLVASTGGPVTFNPPGADPVSITPNFNGNGVLINGVTQFASDSTTAARSQDGYAMGVLENFDIDINGTINGFFSNGLNQAIARVALAKFVNKMGLTKVGDTMFDETPNSGIPIIGEANSPGSGAIAAGFLEMSNVDLAQEFTSMIITQRGYQANAKTITTSDQMLQELMNLKR